MSLTELLEVPGVSRALRAGINRHVVGDARAYRKGSKCGSPLYLLNVDLFCYSFYALQRKASPGVDGVTCQVYESALKGRLVDLHSRVHRAAYRPKPSRRVFMPKADGRQRPLGVAALLCCIQIRYGEVSRKHSRVAPVHLDFDLSQFVRGLRQVIRQC